MDIRECAPSDCQALSEIYNHYIRNTVVTFEQVPVNAIEMEQRVGLVQKTHTWLVGTHNNQIVGFAYAAPWHGRSAYRHTVETTIYLAPEQMGYGYGRRLYGALLESLISFDCHVAIAVIAIPNAASVKLQQALGFEYVGVLHEVGYKFDRWVDVEYWQKRLLV